VIHFVSSLPDFFSAVLGYWISIMTGSVIAAGLLLYEHYRGKTITWGWCVAIALLSLFVACTLAWVNEHDQLVAEKQALDTSAQKNIEIRRSQKAELQRFIFNATNIIEQPLPEQDGYLSENDPQFEKYVGDADKWLSDTSTWLLENLGEKAQRQFLDISHTNVYHPYGPPRSVNQTHLRIITNLEKYRENLITMNNRFYTGETMN
jgi:hypothetical protein